MSFNFGNCIFAVNCDLKTPVFIKISQENIWSKRTNGVPAQNLFSNAMHFYSVVKKNFFWLN